MIMVSADEAQVLLSLAVIVGKRRRCMGVVVVVVAVVVGQAYHGGLSVVKRVGSWEA